MCITVFSNGKIFLHYIEWLPDHKTNNNNNNNNIYFSKQTKQNTRLKQDIKNMFASSSNKQRYA